MLIEGLYTVLKATPTNDSIATSVRLDPDHAVFKGHFPDQPVMPGVCTLQIVQELLEEQLGRPLRLSRSSNIKFLALIDPTVNPDLDIDLTHVATDQGVKVNAKVSIQGTLAVKLSAEFQEADQ